MSETELNIEEIWNIIPHRYPFLLVDRVTEINGFESIKGYKNISINELVFQGHFPIKPVFPGVLMLEAMAQLGAILILRRFPPEKRMAYFTGIDNARFKHAVVPGDRLEMEVTITRDRTTFVIMEGKAYVNGQLAAQATMSSALAK
ncbi:MAG TPA: 3-hydroxyacyl-ACP dehydratase FabZ [Candidatus Deferrimicrobium sp.]|nr:3-hydroxyacyl-ACP dehydratase FabZ [Candidatus Deferrimicrobium sp.]